STSGRIERRSVHSPITTQANPATARPPSSVAASVLGHGASRKKGNGGYSKPRSSSRPRSSAKRTRCRNAPWVSLSQPSCAIRTATMTSGTVMVSASRSRSQAGARASGVTAEAMDRLLPVIGSREELAERLECGDRVEQPVDRVQQREEDQAVQAALEDGEHVHVDRQHVADQQVEPRQVQQDRRKQRGQQLGPRQ